MCVCVFIGVVALQSLSFKVANQTIHETLTASLFTTSSNMLTSEGLVKQTLVFPGVTTTAGIMSWFEQNVLDALFVEPNCGDGVCTAPEEYPKVEMGDVDSLKTWSGCLADCLQAATARVTVDFFDAAKLDAAYQTAYRARRMGWVGKGGPLSPEAMANGWDEPVAGWNICSRTLSEYGDITDDHEPILICLLDGDTDIAGVPYRTAELAYNSSAAQSVDLMLPCGDWELRIAFVNFQKGDIPVAFPSVRGRICGHNGTAACKVWDPCPDASAGTCRCEWIRHRFVTGPGVGFDEYAATGGRADMSVAIGGSNYYCWGGSEFEHLAGESGDFLDTVTEMNLAWMAKLLGIEAGDSEVVPNYASANVSTLRDAEAWSHFRPCEQGAQIHYLFLYNEGPCQEDDIWCNGIAGLPAAQTDDGYVWKGEDTGVYVYEVDPVTGVETLITGGTKVQSNWDDDSITGLREDDGHWENDPALCHTDLCDDHGSASSGIQDCCAHPDWDEEQVCSSPSYVPVAIRWMPSGQCDYPGAQYKCCPASDANDRVLYFPILCPEKSYKIRTVKGQLRAQADEEDDWQSGRSWYLISVDDHGFQQVAHSVNTDECSFYGSAGTHVECGSALLYVEICYTGWCTGGAHQPVADYAAQNSFGTCWEVCKGVFPRNLTAISWRQGECYCEDACTSFDHPDSTCADTTALRRNVELPRDSGRCPERSCDDPNFCYFENAGWCASSNHAMEGTFDATTFEGYSECWDVYSSDDGEST